MNLSILDHVNMVKNWLILKYDVTITDIAYVTWEGSSFSDSK